MNMIQRVASLLLNLAVTVGVLTAAWWLVTQKPPGKSSEKAAPPANVSKVVKEDELNTITLSEAAERRIGLTVGLVEKKSVRRVRMYGGEVAIPAGRSIVVSAPVSGTLRAPASGEKKAGQTVKAGNPIFQMIPLITPDSRATLSAALAESDGLASSAREQADLTKITLERARKVLKQGAGSQKQVDEAQAAYQVASKNLEAALARRGILKKVVGDTESGNDAPITINAPEDGILRVVSALPNQTVPSGAPLFEVVDLATVWIRVPLPVGDVDAIDRTESAQVGSLSAPTGLPQPLAKPIAAPPSANPLASTVDVFYELPNPDKKFHPGQRLGVTIPLRDNRESMILPWSALVYDIHGGTWVYEQVGPFKYSRRRVVVAYSYGESAVLASGMTAGAKIVTAGAQELFGAETGFVK